MDKAKLQAIVECPDCHCLTFRLVKMDTSDSEIDIVCDNCQKTIGKVSEYLVENCDD
mgnify:FL=1